MGLTISFRPALRPMMQSCFRNYSTVRMNYSTVRKACAREQWTPKLGPKRIFLEGAERDDLVLRMASHKSPLKPATPSTSGAPEISKSKSITIQAWIGGAERDNMAHRLRRHGATMDESGKFG